MVGRHTKKGEALEKKTCLLMKLHTLLPQAQHLAATNLATAHVFACAKLRLCGWLVTLFRCVFASQTLEINQKLDILT